jgi:hypothetical protein
LALCFPSLYDFDASDHTRVVRAEVTIDARRIEGEASVCTGAQENYGPIGIGARHGVGSGALMDPFHTRADGYDYTG